MALLEIALKDRRQIARDTLRFAFEKPAGFDYTAGQFIELALIDPKEIDAGDASHTFTLASAPYENDLMIATRMRDTAYKRALRTMPIGTRLRLEGPSGDFTLRDDSQRVTVFLAGGIGVTPFRSIILQASHDKLTRSLVLFCSNRRPEDAPFLKELQRVALQHPQINVLATITQPQPDDNSWLGLRGHLDERMIRASIPELSKAVFYIAGPPGMVEAMRQTLDRAGIRKEDIRFEEFSGY